MSDQDFFFDDEEETVTETAKPSSKPASKTAKTVIARPADEKRAAAPKPAQPGASSPALFEQNVSMTVAALMTVVGLLVGVIIGFLIAPGDVAVPGASSGAGTSAPAGMGSGTTGGTTAPELSEEQLQSGELPPNHPPVGGASGETSATTGTE